MSKVALVTGANGGLGSEICQTLAAAGYQVHGCVRRQQAADALLANLPAGCQAHLLDVLDSAAITRLAALLEKDPGHMDLLVNCAGFTRFVEHRRLDLLDDELIDSIFRVNVRAPLAMVRAFLPLLQAAQGCVVNITSVAARLAMGSNVAYCASKAALANLTRSLARALAPEVRVMAVAPGLVDTDFIQSLSPQWREQQLGQTPLRRFATPKEVASAVLTAAQLAGATGTTLEVDGGRGLGC